eukprot:6460473-Alexandrium_andersonii.AAC.1
MPPRLPLGVVVLDGALVLEVAVLDDDVLGEAILHELARVGDDVRAVVLLGVRPKEVAEQADVHV